MIAVIDYNMGNLRSVQNAFDKVGAEAKIVSDPKEVGKFDKLLLPGVGAFGDAMEHLRKSGMDEAIKDFAKSGKPILGICLGMQLLFEKSYEFGENEGLGL
ncbi:MAG: imidazole glycerol phosphate synthase subunit HisH, partial [Epsilonproteobacteria bacterium]|nr:imidazole glycerol phosphate synthase subunit HisH [Campylobacterota bacterium]